MTEENRTQPRVVKARIAIAGDGIDDLLPEERALAAGLSSHRRAELRAGRLAARAALAGLGLAAAIGREDDGCPVALGLDVKVSISHGRRWAVAAAGRVAQLGIDLCEIERAPSVRRVSARFLHASEQALPTNDVEWAALWALKEAAAKALRLGLFAGGLTEPEVRLVSPPAFARPAGFVAELEVGVEDVVALVYRA